jgi:Flp pilus assembly protein TadG
LDVDLGYFFKRIIALKNDVRGNALMFFAFSLLPLMGMIGGALDMSRAYLVKSRLQNACDAAVLGGRRAMTASTFDTSARDSANRFFALNFSTGQYGVTALTMAYDVGNDMIVHGKAAAVVPTSVMKVFGFAEIPLQATCDAQLQLPNSDIMFVLDTTLSMAETNPGDSQSKIQALRQSVTNFYTSLNNAQSAASQVRYGFVPYSSTVNVGLLLKREWMVDNWDYQSREQDGYVDQSGGTQGPTVTTTSNYSDPSGSKTTTTQPGSSEDCVAPANENYSDSTSYTPWDPSGTAVPRSRTASRKINGSTYSASRASSGVCTITKTTYSSYSQTYTQTVSENPNAGQSNGSNRVYYWNYKKINFPVSMLKGSAGSGLIAGGSFDTMLGNNFTTKTINWGNSSQGACIEERKTLRPNENGTAYDMDVDMTPIPGSADTQWRPFLPDLIWARSVTSYYPSGSAGISGWQANTVLHVSNNYITPGSYKSDFAACPSPARKLAAIRTSAEKSSLTTYLNALVPRGRTYHDIGMLWGLRLLSAEGLFSSENAAAPNGSNISRNLIFMTDGDTETNIADYDAYGLAALDRRRTDASSLPTKTDQDSIVEDRLSRLCTLAKEKKNITVWVIAFGTNLTPLLSNCASPNRSYQANNAAELNQTFSDIAARISQLRVTH